MSFAKWNNSKRQIETLTATRWISAVFAPGLDFHRLQIELESRLRLFGSGWQGLRSERGHARGRRLGQFFAFGIFNSLVGLALLCSEISMHPEGRKTNKTRQKSNKNKKNKKRKTCKHNTEHEERNMIFSCHNTISAEFKKTKKTKKPFPALFALSKNARGWRKKTHTDIVYPTQFFFLFLFVLHEKETVVSISYFGRQRVCQSLDKSGSGSDVINTKRRHWPHSDIWTAATEELPSAEHWVSLVIKLFGFSSHSPRCLIFSHDGRVPNSDTWLRKLFVQMN